MTDQATAAPEFADRLRTEEVEALTTLVGEREWTAFRAGALLAVADLPPNTRGLPLVLLEAALEDLTPGHGAVIEVDDAQRAYLIPRLAGLERRAAELGIEAQSLTVYRDDQFEWDPFSGAPPRYTRKACPPVRPLGTMAALLGTMRREPVQEYVAWRRTADYWMVERLTAEAMETLRLTSPNPQHPSWRRDYNRIARGRVLRNILRGLPRYNRLVAEEKTGHGQTS